MPNAKEELRNIIVNAGQLTSKYPDKKHLLAGENTFISCSQYEDLAQAIIDVGFVRLEDVELSNADLAKIILFIRHNMFLPENDKMAELKKMIIEAIPKPAKR